MKNRWSAECTFNDGLEVRGRKRDTHEKDETRSNPHDVPVFSSVHFQEALLEIEMCIAPPNGLHISRRKRTLNVENRTDLGREAVGCLRVLDGNECGFLA